jgi:hypothetical protein
VKRFTARIVLALILALTVALMDGCAPGCDAAASLFRVAGDSMEGSDHAALNAIPAEQVCVQRPLGLGISHLIDP